MNNTIFSNGFGFYRYTFTRYHYTDNRSGTQHHFFAYMKRGRARLVGEDACLEVAAGDVFYIPSGYRYESYWYGEPDIEFLSLRLLYMPCFGGEGYPMQSIAGTAEEIAQMERITHAPITDAHVGMLYTLVGGLTPRMRRREEGQGLAIVARAREIIAKEPHLNTEAVARQCGVSSSALYAAFARHGDMTPNAWRTHVLCERAREMLITTDRPIEEISRLLGFSSPAYFRKVLHKEYGMAPRELRRLRQV